jgi:hypothetical protein
MATVNNVTKLDFDEIKTDIKSYLSSQNRFKDYDFDGSNLSVLLDILAYNTYQNNFYTNMAINEMFLDSAQLRDTVVSHTKELGYLPGSRTSSHGTVNIRLSVNGSPPSVVIPAKTKFLGKCGNETFDFYNEEAVSIIPVNGIYNYNNLEIYEGTYITEAYAVTGVSDQRYVLSNQNIDVNSIRVTVKQNSSVDTGDEYVYKSNIFGVSGTDKVFYLQAASGNTYEVNFGKDVFGANPTNGNVVLIEYRITNGEEANGVTSFSAATTVAGYNATVTLVAKSYGGSPEETVESIKFFAPKSIQVQDRAITESDYEILLKNNFPEVQAVAVYGGDELNPPQYGRVVIAVDVFNADGLSNNNSVKYYNFLKDRCPIGIEPIIVQPSFMYLSVAGSVNYNIRTTSLSPAAIKTLVENTITTFSNNNLSDFKTPFRYSKFISAVDDTDVNIVSNDIEVLAILPLNPTLNVNTSFDLTFNNPLIIDHPLTEGESVATHKAAVKSSTFTYDGYANASAFIQDDGQGKLQVLRTTTTGFVYLNRNVGTVDYDTGRIIIKGLNVGGYTGSEIKLYGRTLLKDITPPKDRILTIREEDVNVTVYGVRV